MSPQATSAHVSLRGSATTAIATAIGSAGVSLLLFVVPSEEYTWGLIGCLAVAASAVAVVDVRTRRLPNRYVSALAAGGLIQAVAVSAVTRDGSRFVDSLIAAVTVFSAYTLLGLVGWFGFGDAKFAGALTISVAITAGLVAIYIVPLAILFAAAWTLFGPVTGGAAGARAHGPAIALAALCIATGAVLVHPAAS